MIYQLKEALSPLVDGRAFFQVLPESKLVYPALVIQFSSITPNNALTEMDLDDYRVQLDVYDPDPKNLTVMRKKINSVMTESIPFSQRINTFFEYEPDVKLHRLILEFIISSDK